MPGPIHQPGRGRRLRPGLAEWANHSRWHLPRVSFSYSMIVSLQGGMGARTLAHCPSSTSRPGP
jgi:hypothetical protein